MAAIPASPDSLRYSVYSRSSAEIFWNRATDPVLVTAYEVKLNNRVVATIDALSYFTSDLQEGESYRFEVTAINSEGERSSPASVSFIGGDREPSSPPPVQTPDNPPATDSLAAPTNVRAVAYSASTIEVFWDRVTSAVLSYEISIDGVVAGTSQGTSWLTRELLAGRQYDIGVVATDSDGNRSPAASAVVTTQGGSLPDTPDTPDTPDSPDTPDAGDAPPAPSNARLAVYSKTSAELFWDRPAVELGIVSTRVMRNGTLFGETEGTSLMDRQRTPGTDYRYELIAVNAAGHLSKPTVVGDDNPPVVDPPDVDPPVVEPPDDDPDLPPGVFEPSASDISPDLAIYQQDGYGTIDVIRVDIRTVTTPGTCNAEDESGCTLADVLADVDKTDDHTVDIPIHFKSTDFPDDGSISNAELRLRGGGSRFAPQKSFRIKLDSKKVLWRNERHLQLNKHPFEKTRIRNKLAFDLMSEVPHLPSLRTQFVNLWIDDGDGPVDYGLFTHVERVNERFLEKRGFNDEGNIYKAEHFRFEANDLAELAVDENGEPLDEDRFERVLEIEAGKDHRKLVAMLAALHNPARSFQSVLDQYFNYNNVMAWMAVNILVHQADATRHNYILYNPAGSEKFYFMPWDYDAAMGRWIEPANNYDQQALRERIKYGYAVGDQNVFTSRFYRLPGMHERMIDAVDFIRQNYLTDASILEKATQYIQLVAPYETRLPDSAHNPRFSIEAGVRLAENPAKNEQALKTSFSVPMPPTLHEPELRNSRWVFKWKPAYDVTGNSITYDLHVSSSIGFEADNIFIEITGIDDAPRVVEQRVDASRLPSGDYFVRLTARAANEPGRFWQVAGNRLELDGLRYYMVPFSVP